MDIIKVVPSKAIWEMHFLLEYYMRCDGGSIQDKMPEGADLRNIIILYNMPLSNSQRHSQVFTTLPSIFILCLEKRYFKTQRNKSYKWGWVKAHDPLSNSWICIHRKESWASGQVPTKRIQPNFKEAHRQQQLQGKEQETPAISHWPQFSFSGLYSWFCFAFCSSH